MTICGNVVGAVDDRRAQAVAPQRIRDGRYDRTGAPGHDRDSLRRCRTTAGAYRVGGHDTASLRTGGPGIRPVHLASATTGFACLRWLAVGWGIGSCNLPSSVAVRRS